jgi:hypothetical protein
MLKRFIPLAFIVLWIVPVAWVGLMRSSYPLYPAWLAPLFRVSGIFEKAPRQWRIFFIETETNESWHPVDESRLFAPTPLGDRTRFQPLMNQIVDSQPEQAPKLLQWIADRLRQGTAASAKIKAVRIIYFRLPSETFFKSDSLFDAYRIAMLDKLPRMTVATLQSNRS